MNRSMILPTKKITERWQSRLWNFCVMSVEHGSLFCETYWGNLKFINLCSIKITLKRACDADEGERFPLTWLTGGITYSYTLSTRMCWPRWQSSVELTFRPENTITHVKEARQENRPSVKCGQIESIYVSMMQHVLLYFLRTPTHVPTPGTSVKKVICCDQISWLFKNRKWINPSHCIQGENPSIWICNANLLLILWLHWTRRLCISDIVTSWENLWVNYITSKIVLENYKLSWIFQRQRLKR